MKRDGGAWRQAKEHSASQENQMSSHSWSIAGERATGQHQGSHRKWGLLFQGPLVHLRLGQERQSKDFLQGILSLENGLEVSKTRGRSDSQGVHSSAGEDGERWRDSRNMKGVDI